LDCCGSGIKADVAFESGKIDQVTLEIKRRYLITNSFFGLRSGFADRVSDTSQNLSDLRREVRDVFVDRPG
jgi:hypothetical protein